MAVAATKTDRWITGIIDAFKTVAPDGGSLHQPEIAGNEWAYVKDCLDSGWVSSVGSYVDRFEEMLKDYTGAGHAVATVNGTAALHTCLVLAGIEPGNEVIVPALTFISPVNSVSYCGAIPHFVDSSFKTLGLDPEQLDSHLSEVAEIRNGACVNRETGRSISAVICVHVFGHAAELDGLADVCERWNVVLIEDASESLGSFYKGRHTGNRGRLSALSFNGNKIVTTGGGGAVLTNDPNLAKQAKHITTTAKLPHAWEFVHDRIGYNYRLPNINAALGCGQLEQIDDFLRRKRLVAQNYIDAFADIDGIAVLQQPANCRSNYWLNALLLDPEHEGGRDDLLAALNDAGLMSRPAWTPIHCLEMYRDCPRGDLTTAESLALQVICLPSSANLADDDA